MNERSEGISKKSRKKIFIPNALSYIFHTVSILPQTFKLSPLGHKFSQQIINGMMSLISM